MLTARIIDIMENSGAYETCMQCGCIQKEGEHERCIACGNMFDGWRKPVAKDFVPYIKAYGAEAEIEV